MTPSLASRIRGFRQRAREKGLGETLRRALLARLANPGEGLPFSRINPTGLFASDVNALHEEERKRIRASSFLMDASQVESTYPHHIESQGKILRYAFIPALETSRGLAVLFHGHDAFLHMGPLSPWRQFDVLAPWDTFGYKRQGSWFWGEKGQPFVEALVQDLIQRHLARAPGLPWFATGASMGGFGALWHGLKFGASGIYAQCPQIDLARKIEDFGRDEPTNPYRHLLGPESDGLPDILALAASRHDLPPLFLIQNQHDHINPFAEHAWKLLEIYNSKSAWYGLRIHPSVGHGGDGSQAEAEMFFACLIDKSPAHRFKRES
jgi:hypothetical protein